MCAAVPGGQLLSWCRRPQSFFLSLLFPLPSFPLRFDMLGFSVVVGVPQIMT